MDIYKKGQAKNYRVIFAGILRVVSVYAAYKWFAWTMDDILFGQPYLRLDWIGAGILLILGGACAFYFAFMNRKAVDHVILTEEEMRKVSWPSKEELISSSIVVVVVMLILGIITTVLDFGFIQVLDILKGIISSG